MRTESRVFNVIAAFLYLVAAIYAWWTGSQRAIEWAGTTALLLSATLAVACGLYFAFITRRIAPRPEDRDADMEEGAGDIGFFSPGSYWPLGLGLTAALAAIGIAMQQWWLAVLGIAAALLATGGLLFENYHLKGKT